MTVDVVGGFLTLKTRYRFRLKLEKYKTNCTLGVGCWMTVTL